MANYLESYVKEVKRYDEEEVTPFRFLLRLPRQSFFFPLF